MDIQTLTEIVKIQSQLLNIMSKQYLDYNKGGTQRDKFKELLNDLKELQK